MSQATMNTTVEPVAMSNRKSRWAMRVGLAGTGFFLIKGLVWLALAVWAAWSWSA